MREVHGKPRERAAFTNDWVGAVRQPDAEPPSRHVALEKGTRHPLSINPSAISSTRTGIAPQPTQDRMTIDRLAHKLGRQDLRLDDPNPVQPWPSSPCSSSFAQLAPERPAHQTWPGRLPGHDRGHDPLLEVAPCVLARGDDFSGLLHASPASPIAVEDCAMVTDDEDAGPDGTEPGRRHPSSSKGNGTASEDGTARNNSPASSRLALERVQEMIATSSQCSIHSAPLPASTARSLPATSPNDGVFIDLSCVHLEVDEACVAGEEPTDEELLRIQSSISLRRAGQPGGIRKRGLPALQTSADAGIHRSTFVRNRPRMRRRDRSRPGSKASSAVTSAISSPVIPPSLPDAFSL